MDFRVIHAVEYCFIYIWKSGPQQIEGTAIKHERMALNFFMASARTRKANITFLFLLYICIRIEYIKLFKFLQSTFIYYLLLIVSELLYICNRH